MAIFTAIAAAVTSALVGAGVAGVLATVGGALFAGALAIGASRLIAKRMLRNAQAGGDGGGRVQLPPATDNKIPVVYGSAFLGGPIIDAYLTPDQKTMYYVIALAEKTDNGTISFGTIYYDGKEVTLVGTNVTQLTTNTTPEQIDTRVNGKISMWFYNDGSQSPTNSSDNAYDIFPKWNNDPNYAMTNCAFVVVRVNYNTDAGTTNLGALTVEVINTESGRPPGVYRPGTAIYDYMTNTRYGCAIPSSKVDGIGVGTSLYDLNVYSDETITYTTVGGGSDTMPRYRLNGPLDTATNCLDNLQLLVDSCDSWLQYSELTGEWKVVINKPYTSTMYQVDSSNLISGIQISPLDLNDTYNQLEVAYPNANIKDQTDYQVILLQDYQVGVMSPNEAVNRLNMTLPLTNNAVQAKYLGIRRLLQSREDLVISFVLDFSGIQLEAGDVVQVTHETYGWVDKEFRISQVVEEKLSDGTLQARCEALEYNASIYNDQALTDYIPAFNTGLLDPNVITIPGTPTANLNPDDTGAITSFKITSAVPESGSIIYMDFNYGNNSNVEQHVLYRTVQAAAGQPFTNSTDIANNVVNNISIDINDLVAGTYYFSSTARNDFAGRVSLASNAFVWPGANINAANIIDGNGVFSNGNILTSNSAISNISVNSNVYIVDGTGQLANNTYITVVNSTNPANFIVTPTPIIALNNANIIVVRSGINGNAIVPNTMPGNRVTANTMNGNVLINGTVNGNVLVNGTVNGNVLIANTVNGNVIIANTLNGNTIQANTINGNTIIANTLNGNTITANTLNGNTIIANTLNGNTITANTLNGNSIIANTLNGNTITANTLNGNSIIANTLNGNSILANTVNGNTIIANTMNGNVILANTLNGNSIIANTINGNAIIGNTINGNTILANTLNGNTIIANTLNGNTIIANTMNGNVILANTLNGNTILANTINGNTIIANTMNGNVILANTLNGNSIIANTINGNSIIANTIDGNTIIANTINGNSIIANTINGNTIIANTIDGNKIIGNTVNGNVIIANTLNGNSIQAFSINGGVAFIAGTIEAQAIKANTITFENLAIGAVTQSKSTLSDPIVKPIPFTNISNAWPANTRCVVPSGGVTIIPSTDPQSSANTEYTEGSRIQVSYSVKMYVDPGNVANTSQNWDQYNLVEIWKSGASSTFDRGFNTIRQSYDLTANTTNANAQQIHAYGYAPGGVDLYSSDGGNTWQTYNANSTTATAAGALTTTTTNFSTYPRTVNTGLVGPYQPNQGNFTFNDLPYVGTGVRDNFGTGLGAKIYWTSGGSTSSNTAGIGYITSNGGAVTRSYQNDFNSLEFAPDTGGNGYPYQGSTINDPNCAGYIVTGNNGDIFFMPTASTPPTSSAQAGSTRFRRENVPNLIKDLYASYSNPPQANTFTAVIVGQQGTILRSSRTLGQSSFANAWTAKSTYVGGNISQPLLTDLYAVAGDNTDNSPATSKWCAVGQYGMIQVSQDDGDTWTQVNLGANVTCDFNGVRYGNGKWVACGDGGNIYVSSNIANANAWTQINTGLSYYPNGVAYNTPINYTNGATYGSIYGSIVDGNANVVTNTNARQLNTVNYNGEWDTWSIGGQGIILYSDDNANSFQVAYEETASETYDLTRVTFFGSWPNVANVSRPPAEQRILNNQIFSGTILDTGYVAGQETTYYLVIGNMNGNAILAGQIFLQVQEIKR